MEITATVAHSGTFGFTEEPPLSEWTEDNEPVEHLWEMDVGDKLRDSYIYVLSAVGVPGNIISIITIATMKPLTSPSIYVICLAMVDTIALLSKLMLEKFTQYQVFLTQSTCKILIITADTMMMYANWILVAMTVERFIATWFPFHVKRICTRKNTIIVIGTSFLLFLSLTGYYWWAVDVIRTDFKKSECDIKDEVYDFFYGPWVWVDALIYAFVPCICVIFFNSMIVYKIVKHRRIRKHITTNVHSDEISKQMDITNMLLGISVAFVLLNLPNAAYNVWEYFHFDEYRWDNDSHYNARISLVAVTIDTLSSTNHAVNFFFYFLTGKKFREKFLSLLRCCTHSE